MAFDKKRFDVLWGSGKMGLSEDGSLLIQEITGDSAKTLIEIPIESLSEIDDFDAVVRRVNELNDMILRKVECRLNEMKKQHAITKD